MTVRVVTDSSCDLPEDIRARLEIEIVPLHIRIGDKTYVDRFELNTAEFWRRSEESPTLPETAAPSTGAFQEMFEKLIAEGATGIVCLNISGELSATIQSAQLAAKALEGGVPIEVIDSRSVSVGLGLMCITAAETAAAGADITGVVGAVRPLVENMHVVAALDTLENLKKGGRIGAAQAAFGTLLNFKPCIRVEGVVEEAGKPRTRVKSLRFVVNEVAKSEGVARAAVVHADAARDVDRFLALLSDVVPSDAVEMVTDLGPVVGSHGGRGVIGIAWHA